MKKKCVTFVIFLLTIISPVSSLPSTNPHTPASSRSWSSNYLEKIAESLNIPVQLLEIILTILIIIIIAILAIVIYLVIRRLKQKTPEK